MMDSGFLARLLLVEPPLSPAGWTDEELDASAARAWALLISALYHERLLPEGPRLLHIEEDARGLLAEFTNKCGATAHELPAGPTRSALGKGPGLCLRLAAILHLAYRAADGEALDDDTPVTGESTRRGVELADWLLREQARVYELHGYDAAATGTPNRLRELAGRLPGAFNARNVVAGSGPAPPHRLSALRRAC
jgi:hypothetical protein